MGIGTDFTQGYGKPFFDWLTLDKGHWPPPDEFWRRDQPGGFAHHRRFPQSDCSHAARRLEEKAEFRKIMGENWLGLLGSVWG